MIDPTSKTTEQGQSDGPYLATYSLAELMLRDATLRLEAAERKSRMARGLIVVAMIALCLSCAILADQIADRIRQ